MTLKSIELTGFKSFGRKSLITFTTPITGIVGPNGSGKSNIVEAIRFVLGEQSMKSLRGKGGVDLIFKGSKTLTSSSRARVAITFDNKKKNFSFTNSGTGISLDYDEIVISREVFPDGSNRYGINGTEVRLKDVIDLLASVNIGSSGHHIISQGEADRVLNASNKDRKAMIEDALGLRVYQYRIREAERKLEKTSLNMKEVQSLRREIAPHLNFLKKQVQIVEKAKNMREELKELYHDYLSKESTYINNEIIRLDKLKEELDSKNRILVEQIKEIEKEKDNIQKESEYLNEIKENEIKLEGLRKQKDELAHSFGKLEGILEGLKRQIEKLKEKKERVISESEWKSVIEDVSNKIDEAILSGEISEIVGILKEIKNRIKNLYDNPETNTKVDPELENEFNEIIKKRDEINIQLDKIKEEEKNILSLIYSLREKERESQEVIRDSERVYYELLKEKNEVDSDIHSFNFEKEKLSLVKSSFEAELVEAGVLIGRDIAVYARTSFDGEIDRSSQEEARRKIERIKIKLEDIGSGSGTEVLKEYEETMERDSFLEKELLDLKESSQSLNLLIKELKESLDKEFKEGVDKINKQFNEFFGLMFGGGKASLSVTMEYKKTKKLDEVGEELLGGVENGLEDNGEGELGFERGIDIDVSLPHKKVKDLNMLSGGERSLTSIALLFAISQVNPPPFLVLDETDAALDEANSRKYGDMLLNLSRYSELILVTHNRETMSRASVLYGITMGSEGVSKLLSIKLEDATTYAK